MNDDRPANLEALLLKMIAIDTSNERPSGKPGAEGPLADYLERVAKAAGLETARLDVAAEPSNLLTVCEVAPDAPWLLFVSHMDTVSAEGMTIDPFAGEIRDGRIYGRGACDTKGSGAAMLWALTEYASGPRGPNNVAILNTVSEEFGMTGAASFVDRDLPGLDWTPVGVVVGEPTELRAVTAHNGVVRWSIATRGVSAHSSDPSVGRSAISMMVEVIRAIESQYIAVLDVSHPLTGRGQCSINLIRGGSQINIIPARCEIDLDRRTVPGEDGHQVVSDVEALLDQLRKRDPNLVVEQTGAVVVPALDPSTNERWAGHVCGILKRLGVSPEPVGAKYGTEASAFGQVGVPAIVLGPGSAAQAHTGDEWLAIEQLSRAYEIYLEIMRTRV